MPFGVSRRKAAVMCVALSATYLILKRLKARRLARRKKRLGNGLANRPRQPVRHGPLVRNVIKKESFWESEDILDSLSAEADQVYAVTSSSIKQEPFDTECNMGFPVVESAAVKQELQDMEDYMDFTASEYSDIKEELPDSKSDMGL